MRQLAEETGIFPKQSSICHAKPATDFLPVLQLASTSLSCNSPRQNDKIPQCLEDNGVQKFLKDTGATHCQDTQKQENQNSFMHKSSFTKVLFSLGGGKVAPEEGKKEVERVVGLGEKDFRPPLCGEIPFSTQGGRTSVAQFATVHNEKYNEHLMRFFVDKVWALPRPDVIISVAGGGGYFKLSAGHKDRIMKGMMEGTRNLKPWFITGGTDAGVSKYVAEARAKYNPHAPLIGIAPLGALKGFSKLRRICQEESEFVKETDDSSGRWRWTSKEAGDERWKVSKAYSAPDVWEWHAKSGSWRCSYDNLVLSYDKLVEMDEIKPNRFAYSVEVQPNHSHFIFVDHDGGKSLFGEELAFRAAFESCESMCRVSLSPVSLPSSAFLSTASIVRDCIVFPSCHGVLQ